jgi:uncharacterized protein (UPF0332 family)
MFSVLALLAARWAETSRHSGAISQFDQLYIKPGTLHRDYSRWLHDAFLRRQAADYGAEAPVSADEIEELLITPGSLLPACAPTWKRIRQARAITPEGRDRSARWRFSSPA